MFNNNALTAIGCEGVIHSKQVEENFAPDGQDGSVGERSLGVRMAQEHSCSAAAFFEIPQKGNIL